MKKRLGQFWRVGKEYITSRVYGLEVNVGRDRSETVYWNQEAYKNQVEGTVDWNFFIGSMAFWYRSFDAHIVTRGIFVVMAFRQDV